MALQLDYPDPYLARYCTDEREARAFAWVDSVPPFDRPWVDDAERERWRAEVARLRCYVIAAMENQGAPDDLFASKASLYRSELHAAVASAAKAARIDAAGFLFSIPIERA